MLQVSEMFLEIIFISFPNVSVPLACHWLLPGTFPLLKDAPTLDKWKQSQSHLWKRFRIIWSILSNRYGYQFWSIDIFIISEELLWIAIPRHCFGYQSWSLAMDINSDALILYQFWSIAMDINSKVLISLSIPKHCYGYQFWSIDILINSEELLWIAIPRHCFGYKFWCIAVNINHEHC